MNVVYKMIGDNPFLREVKRYGYEIEGGPIITWKNGPDFMNGVLYPENYLQDPPLEKRDVYAYPRPSNYTWEPYTIRELSDVDAGNRLRTMNEQLKQIRDDMRYYTLNPLEIREMVADFFPEILPRVDDVLFGKNGYNYNDIRPDGNKEFFRKHPDLVGRFEPYAGRADAGSYSYQINAERELERQNYRDSFANLQESFILLLHDRILTSIGGADEETAYLDEKVSDLINNNPCLNRQEMAKMEKDLVYAMDSYIQSTLDRSDELSRGQHVVGDLLVMHNDSLGGPGPKKNRINITRQTGAWKYLRSIWTRFQLWKENCSKPPKERRPIRKEKRPEPPPRLERPRLPKKDLDEALLRGFGKKQELQKPAQDLDEALRGFGKKQELQQPAQDIDKALRGFGKERVKQDLEQAERERRGAEQAKKESLAEAEKAKKESLAEAKKARAAAEKSRVAAEKEEKAERERLAEAEKARAATEKAEKAERERLAEIRREKQAENDRREAKDTSDLLKKLRDEQVKEKNAKEASMQKLEDFRKAETKRIAEAERMQQLSIDMQLAKHAEDKKKLENEAVLLKTTREAEKVEAEKLLNYVETKYGNLTLKALENSNMSDEELIGYLKDCFDEIKSKSTSPDETIKTKIENASNLMLRGVYDEYKRRKAETKAKEEKATRESAKVEAEKLLNDVKTTYGDLTLKALENSNMSEEELIEYLKACFDEIISKNTSPDDTKKIENASTLMLQGVYDEYNRRKRTREAEKLLNEIKTTYGDLTLNALDDGNKSDKELREYLDERFNMILSTIPSSELAEKIAEETKIMLRGVYNEYNRRKTTRDTEGKSAIQESAKVEAEEDKRDEDWPKKEGRDALRIQRYEDWLKKEGRNALRIQESMQETTQKKPTLTSIPIINSILNTTSIETIDQLHDAIIEFNKYKNREDAYKLRTLLESGENKAEYELLLKRMKDISGDGADYYVDQSGNFGDKLEEKRNREERKRKQEEEKLERQNVLTQNKYEPLPRVVPPAQGWEENDVQVEIPAQKKSELAAAADWKENDVEIQKSILPSAFVDYNKVSKGNRPEYFRPVKVITPEEMERAEAAQNAMNNADLKLKKSTEATPQEEKDRIQTKLKNNYRAGGKKNRKSKKNNKRSTKQSIFRRKMHTKSKRKGNRMTKRRAGRVGKLSKKK